MKLEFKTYELKKESKMYKSLVKTDNKLNKFIIVGEESIGKLDCFKAQQLDDNGIILVVGLKIDDAYLIEKKDLELLHGYGTDITELNIPKEFLTMEIIENIQRLNQ